MHGGSEGTKIFNSYNQSAWRFKQEHSLSLTFLSLSRSISLSLLNHSLTLCVCERESVHLYILTFYATHKSCIFARDHTPHTYTYTHTHTHEVVSDCSSIFVARDRLHALCAMPIVCPHALCLIPYALCRRSRSRFRIAAALSWQEMGCRSSLKVNANSLQVTAEGLQLSAKSLPSSR